MCAEALAKVFTRTVFFFAGTLILDYNSKEAKR
jgi:hypothetical protein